MDDGLATSVTTTRRAARSSYRLRVQHPAGRRAPPVLPQDDRSKRCWQSGSGSRLARCVHIYKYKYNIHAIYIYIKIYIRIYIKRYIRMYLSVVRRWRERKRDEAAGDGRHENGVAHLIKTHCARGGGIGGGRGRPTGVRRGAVTWPQRNAASAPAIWFALQPPPALHYVPLATLQSKPDGRTMRHHLKSPRPRRHCTCPRTPADLATQPGVRTAYVWLAANFLFFSIGD